jgi:hypothetical protein
MVTTGKLEGNRIIMYRAQSSENPTAVSRRRLLPLPMMIWYAKHAFQKNNGIHEQNNNYFRTISKENCTIVYVNQPCLLPGARAFV